MAPKKVSTKKVSIKEPVKEEVKEETPFSPPPESPEEIKARIAKEREDEQRELDNAWKMIPYVDQKELGPGTYAGMDMMSLLKPWQFGGHPHDFFKASRLSRPTDLAKHYEFGELLKRHDNCVFELEAWRQREFLKDAMMVQMVKMYQIQKERAKYQKLRKQIRREQLGYEETLRWPLSPHAVRSGFETESEDEEEAQAQEPGELAGDAEVPEGELPEGLPPEPPALEASTSEAGEEVEGARSETGGSSSPSFERKKKKKKRGPTPRMRYSLFHYDMPRQLKRVVPPSPPEKPPEYSTPNPFHSPAWVKGKAAHDNELAQMVKDLDVWEEKLPAGGGGGGGAGKKGSVKKSVKK